MIERKEVPITVRLGEIRNSDVLNPIFLKATLDWSLKKDCKDTDVSCPVLDPRSSTKEKITFPKIFFQTGKV